MGQGKVDKFGITTIYHEFYHASQFQKSIQNSGFYFTNAIGEASYQDWPKPANGSAQFFGEKVFSEVIKKEDTEESNAIISKIELKQRQVEVEKK